MVRCRLRRTFKGAKDSPRSNPTQPAQRARSSRQAKIPRLGSGIGDRVTGQKRSSKAYRKPSRFCFVFEINRAGTCSGGYRQTKVLQVRSEIMRKICPRTYATTSHRRRPRQDVIRPDSWLLLSSTPKTPQWNIL